MKQDVLLLLLLSTLMCLQLDVGDASSDDDYGTLWVFRRQQQQQHTNDRNRLSSRDDGKGTLSPTERERTSPHHHITQRHVG